MAENLVKFDSKQIESRFQILCNFFFSLSQVIFSEFKIICLEKKVLAIKYNY